MILPDELGDWRLAVAVRVSREGSPPEGEIAWKMTATTDRVFGSVMFPTPSPVALPLSVALSSALKARLARNDVSFPKAMADGSRAAEGPQVAALYNYLEASMVAAIFSFQALEAFCNQAIARQVTEPFPIKQRKKERRLTAEQLERSLSTHDKLTVVLPRLFSTAFAGSEAAFGEYQALKDLRDDIVHLKSKDQYVRGRPDDTSVYHRMLQRDAVSFPSAAVGVMRHFIPSGRERWLDAALDYLRAVREAA
jgi:hypothetical protein